MLLAGILLILGSSLQAGDYQKIPDATYDYLHWNVHVNGNKSSVTVSAQVTINHSRGDDNASIYIQERSSSKLKKFNARVLDAHATEILTRDKDDLDKYCGFGAYSVYVDICHYEISLERAQYPYTIEYEYVLECDGLFYLPSATFQQNEPVTEAKYTLDAPTECEIRYKTYELDLVPTITETGDRLIHVWEARDLKPYDPPEFLPPAYRGRGRLVVSAGKFDFDKYRFEGSSWDDVGAWYAGLAAEKYLQTDISLPPVGQDLKSTARLLYDEVVDATRYVAVTIGIGGWQPHAAELTAKRGYGDCKDMTTLLISRMRQQGIEAYPSLLLTRSNGTTDTTFPDFIFNHVIVTAVIDGDTLWADPTCDNCPFGQVRRDSENLSVLLIDDSGGSLVRTPASTSDQNKTIRTSQLHIEADRKLTIATTLEATGNYAAYLRNVLQGASNDDTRRIVDRQFPGANKKFLIHSYQIDELDDPYLPLTITITATATKPCRRIDSVIYAISFPFASLDGYEKVELEDRVEPVDVVYPETVQLEVTLTWDTQLGVDSVVLPAPLNLQFPFGEIRFTYEHTHDTVQISSHKIYRVYQIEPEHFGDFSTFCSTLRKRHRQNVKLVTSSSE